MSTYGVIARRTASGGFVGRLHQNVGNPHILGRALYRLRNGHFRGDTAAMLRVLIDEHPAGWSDITGKDFALAPGFVSMRSYLSWEQYLTLPDAYQPQCYCHGERSDPPKTFTEAHTPMDASFLYVIDEVAHTMDIYLYRWPPFSVPMAEPERHLIGSVALDGPEPSWKRYDSERIFYNEQEWAQRQQTKHMVVGWLHAAPGQPCRCHGCGDHAAGFIFEHFGYEGMELDMAGWEGELDAAETEDSSGVPLKLFARVRRKLLEAQQQGISRTSAAEPLCDSCLADFIDAYLGEEGTGELVVAELRSSGGLLSYALAWEMHCEEAQRLDFPYAFYTNAQTIDHVQAQFCQLNDGQP
jgi:hypothetical protein